MSKPRKSHCKRGHRFTNNNSRWRVSRGYTIRGCKQCENMLARLKYRNEKLNGTSTKSNQDRKQVQAANCT